MTDILARNRSGRKRTHRGFGSPSGSKTLEPDGRACGSLAPAILTRAGWTSSSVQPGDEVTIILFPAKNGAAVACIGSGDPETKVVFSNGKELDFQDRTTK